MISSNVLLRTLEGLGLADAKQIAQAVSIQHEHGKRLGRILVELGALRSEEAINQIAGQIGVVPELEGVRVDQEVEAPLAVSVAREHRVVPLGLNEGKVVLATDQLVNALADEYLAAACGSDVAFVYVQTEKFEALFQERYAQELAAASAMERAAQDDGLGDDAAEVQPGEAGEEAPIVRLVDRMIEDAYVQRASDIHIEPHNKRLRIRFRVDGVLLDVQSPPDRLHGAIISRVKLLAGMDIAEKRLPQDGRIQRTIRGKSIDFRVSSLPSMHGETIVMRLLDKSSALVGVEELGMNETVRQKFSDLLAAPYGMILVTGPTGSGKTTTLYAALSRLNTTDRKLITVEDPVEYQIGGINQVQVSPQVGLTFAQGLRSMLRQAPDVIMVGEIRDLETAQVAIQAALTGHLVFSTLHTNDAASAVTRLVDMGVPPYLVASTVQGVLAQRLVRRVCRQCAAPYAPGLDELAPFGVTGEKPAGDFVRTAGCSACSKTGYLGRLGVYELLTMSEPLRELVYVRAPSSTLRERAVQSGMQTLAADGFEKAGAGLTTLAEVLRIAAGM